MTWIILASTASFILGALFAARFISIRLFPKLNRLRDEAIAEQEALSKKRAEYVALQQGRISEEYERVMLKRQLAEKEAELQSVLNDPTRQRVIELAEQLSAHLRPDNVATMVGRKS